MIFFFLLSCLKKISETGWFFVWVFWLFFFFSWVYTHIVRFQIENLKLASVCHGQLSFRKKKSSLVTCMTNSTFVFKHLFQNGYFSQDHCKCYFGYFPTHRMIPLFVRFSQTVFGTKFIRGQ